MELDGIQNERLRTLEDQVGSFRADFERFQGLPLGVGEGRKVRLARTVRKGSEYPDSGDTFAIVFLEGAYPAMQGEQAATYEPRQNPLDPRHYVHHIDGEYLDEGTELLAWEVNGQWWTSGSVGSQIQTLKFGTVEAPGSGYIDHDATGDVKILGTTGCGNYTDPPEPETVQICNATHVRLWHGAPIVIGRVRFNLETEGQYSNTLTVDESYNLTLDESYNLLLAAPGSSGGDPGEVVLWLPLEAYSATLIRGNLVSDTWPDTADPVIDTVQPLDGHFVPGSSQLQIDNSLLQLWGCSGQTVLAKWDDEADLWRLIAVRPNPVVQGEAIAGSDACSGTGESVTLQADSLKLWGYACTPDQAQFSVTNDLDIPIKTGDLLYLQIDLVAKVARITDVEQKLRAMVYEVTDPGSGAIVVNCIYVGVNTCDDPASCGGIPTEECP